jgi:Protein of unknown function (DUF3467)
VEPDRPQERQLNITVDDKLAGSYANFAHVSFSPYEFTIDFMRIEHEAEGLEVPGVLVSRINVSARFVQELIGALQDSFSKWETREGIRNLPETPGE